MTVEVTFHGVDLEIDVDNAGEPTDWIEASISAPDGQDIADLLQYFSKEGWGAYDELLGKVDEELRSQRTEAAIDAYRELEV